jgi:hypothetical protein
MQVLALNNILPKETFKKTKHTIVIRAKLNPFWISIAVLYGKAEGGFESAFALILKPPIF